jgi:transposase
MNAYPIKFRKRAVEALRNGSMREEVNKMFGLGVNTLRCWEKLEERTGSLEDRPSNRGAREKLLQYYKENPYSTDKEAANVFNCSASGIEHAKKAAKITRKKTQFYTKKETSKNEKNLLQK